MSSYNNWIYFDIVRRFKYVNMDNDIFNPPKTDGAINLPEPTADQSVMLADPNWRDIMRIKWQYRLKMMLLIIILFCCVASNANSQCYGSGMVASSKGEGSIYSPNPSVIFGVPYYQTLIQQVTTYHEWIGSENQPPAQVYMTITDDAGNIYYEGVVPFIYEGLYGGKWLGRATATPTNLVLPEGNSILAVDAYQSWLRGPEGSNPYDISGMPCPRMTREECLACG
jgi:hypothetical protein